MDAPCHQNLSFHKSPFGNGHKCLRVIWALAWLLLFRPSPRPLHAWRRLLLRLFGARIGRNVRIDASCRVFVPWNLEVGDWCVIGPGTDLHTVGKIVIGQHTMVSQYCHLCAGTHDPRRANLPLLAQNIAIGQSVWICAGAFVGPGVAVGEGAVVGARAVAFQEVKPWSVVMGNPCKAVFPRRIVAE